MHRNAKGLAVILQPESPADPDAIRWPAIRSALSGFVLPSMLAQVIATVANTVVIASIGRLAGVDALAGVSAFFPVLGLLLAFLGGLGAGASVLVAQSSGRGDAMATKAVAGNAIALAAIFGVAVGIAGLLSVVPLLHALGVAEPVIVEGSNFARVALCGAPILFVYAVYTIALQGGGDAWTPMWGSVLQALFTIALVPRAIVGWGPVPPLGAGGAAGGLVASSLLAGVAVAAWLTVKRSPLGVDAAFLRALIPRRATIVQLLRIGLPSGANSALLSLSEVVVIGLVSRQGTSAIAAYGAVGQVMGYIAVPSSSIAGAASIFGAQAVGRGRFGQLSKIARIAVIVGLVIAVPFAVLVEREAAPLMQLFVHDPPTVALGAVLIGIVAWSLPLTVVTQVLAGVMRATKTVTWPTLVSVGAVWAVQLPVAIVASRPYGIEGIWAGYPAANAAAFALTLAYYLFVWRRNILASVGARPRDDATK